MLIRKTLALSQSSNQVVSPCAGEPLKPRSLLWRSQRRGWPIDPIGRILRSAERNENVSWQKQQEAAISINHDPKPTKKFSRLIVWLFSQACDDDPHAKLVGEVVELWLYEQYNMHSFYRVGVYWNYILPILLGYLGCNLQLFQSNLISN